MKFKFTALALLIFTALSPATRASESARQARTEQSITGTWKGKFDDMPAVDVVLKMEGGRLVGTATFYLVENTGAGAVVKSKNELPMLDLRLEALTLSFKVKRNDGSIFEAGMKFVGDNEAVLKPGGAANDADENKIFMIREK